eukprot:TRINITY_DN20627_c0_g1_i3.p1 TRINITY_DN20627_c0_g1~~TRINITY_DN20627_c0_g1_i3.p1  ORF type:complete len:111 (+),score=28.87 TRINITY_DN20627_c0_g1_i3:215-547(+)
MMRTTYKFRASGSLRNCLKAKKEKYMSINDETIKEMREDMGVESDYEGTAKSRWTIPRFNIKAIEVWINSMLGELEPSVFPKTVLEDKSRTPLSRFGIDREMLTVFSFVT